MEDEPEREAEFDPLAAGEDMVEHKETPWPWVLVVSGVAVAMLVCYFLF